MDTNQGEPSESGYSENFVRVAHPGDVAHELNRLLKERDEARKERDELQARAPKAYVRGVCDALSAEHGNNMSLISAALEDVLAPVIDLSCR